jgi:NAD(P)-dependent dehydrogenase (short-subunit alcohol dehydrogenase family)
LFYEVGEFDHLVITVRPPQPDSVTFPDIDIAQVKLAFETKFWGQFQLIQKASKYISQKGSVVLTTGIAGERIYKGTSTMAIINGASEALCRSLALELAPLRVNAVSPGFIAPKPESIEKIAMEFPAGGLGKADDVAEAYLYLLCNPYATGTTVIVDGGARLV